MTEWSKVHDWKSCVPARVPRVRIPLSPPKKIEGSWGDGGRGDAGVEGAVCTPVCTPLEPEVLEAAIERVTRALLVAADEDIPTLVSERAAMREELHRARIAVFTSRRVR